MWLINTKTLELQEFPEGGIPEYAIVSHTWEAGEVSFALYQDPERRQAAPGWTKIRQCCDLALFNGHAWLWIDTCCIDKRSSAELTEAINSMFAWYERASCCFVYLCDVDGEQVSTVAERECFRKSRWFTRGWTLQELLAPVDVVFLNCRFEMLGTKRTLRDEIGNVTGIDAVALAFFTPHDYSVAAKMSWAATRETTRKEDEAYSLMGLFDVNMPLLYGEGRKAFDRLQLEVMRQVDDESIFAWNYDRRSFADPPTQHGLLAPSPREFERSGDYVPHEFHSRPAYHVTNKGLQIHLHKQLVHSGLGDSSIHIYRCVLNCRRQDRDLPMVIFLTHSTRRRHCRVGPLKELRCWPCKRVESHKDWEAVDIERNFLAHLNIYKFLKSGNWLKLAEECDCGSR